MMVEMIPVLDENGNQVKNGKGNPKYKRLSEATPEEKALKKEGKLKSSDSMAIYCTCRLEPGSQRSSRYLEGNRPGSLR